jgi:intein/homing endonuclease
MKRLILFIGLAIGFCTGRAQTKPIDDGNYLIAQQELKDGNYLTAYRNYLIFEYSNYDRINLPVNRNAKQALEFKIARLEDYLNQSINILIIKKGYGWSDGTADSVIQSKKAVLTKELKPPISFN